MHMMKDDVHIGHTLVYSKRVDRVYQNTWYTQPTLKLKRVFEGRTSTVTRYGFRGTNACTLYEMWSSSAGVGLMVRMSLLNMWSPCAGFDFMVRMHLLDMWSTWGGVGLIARIPLLSMWSYLADESVLVHMPLLNIWSPRAGVDRLPDSIWFLFAYLVEMFCPKLNYPLYSGSTVTPYPFQC